MFTWYDMSSIRMFIIAAFVSAICCGCLGPNNNYLKPEDFANHLAANGVKVDGVRRLPPDPFRASSGAAIMIHGSEIGVYKYDTSSRVQAKRIKRLEETGRTYINGIPYPVEVYGSFMVMGLEKNVKKHEIVRALRKFE